MYRKFVRTWLCTVGICVSILFVCSVIIDPIGILETTIIRGINNYKIEQNSYVYVFKPYEYRKHNADVVFIGSSRVHAGLRAGLLKQDLHAYNFGCSGMTLPHMEEILKFIYKVNKPKEVYIGLDFFQFSEGHFKSVKNGFSTERLEDLANKNETGILLRAVKENFMLSKSLLPTIKMSLKNKDTGDININGWNAKDGSLETCNRKAFYGAINQYKKAYSKYFFTPDSIRCLERIVNDAKQQNVRLVVFMNPINIDLFALLNAYDLYDEFETVKKLIVSTVGVVYDFNFIDKYTCNRTEMYLDAAHYNAKFGDRIKNDIWHDEDTDMLHVLTVDSIEGKLREQRCINELWVAENTEYINYLKARADRAEKIEQGELKRFIGV